MSAAVSSGLREVPTTEVRYWGCLSVCIITHFLQKVIYLQARIEGHKGPDSPTVTRRQRYSPGLIGGRYAQVKQCDHDTKVEVDTDLQKVI